MRQSHNCLPRCWSSVSAVLEFFIYGVRGIASCQNLREVRSEKASSHGFVPRQLLDRPKGPLEIFLVPRTIGPGPAPVTVSIKLLGTPRPPFLLSLERPGPIEEQWH